MYISSTRVASAINPVGDRPEAFEMLGAPLYPENACQAPLTVAPRAPGGARVLMPPPPAAVAGRRGGCVAALPAYAAPGAMP